jgi:hypothetical protein
MIQAALVVSRPQLMVLVCGFSPCPVVLSTPVLNRANNPGVYQAETRAAHKEQHAQPTNLRRLCYYRVPITKYTTNAAETTHNGIVAVRAWSSV